MKFIPSVVHGVFDYIVGLALIIIPIIVLPAEAPSIATIIPVGVGVLIVGLALITNYELGLLKKVEMSSHTMIDNGIGVFLAVSPWLFGFFEITYGVHLLAGLIILFFGLFTNSLTATNQLNTKSSGEVSRDYLDNK